MLNDILERSLLIPELEPGASLRRTWTVDPQYIAIHALKRLWEKKEFPGQPLLLGFKNDAKKFHPELLDKVLAKAQKKTQQKSKPGQLRAWELLAAPEEAGEIGAAPIRDGIYDSNMQIRASIYDQKTVPGPYKSGWFLYQFDGWSALAVLMETESEDEAISIVAMPKGQQDAWLAFQVELQRTFYSQLKRTRWSRIEIVGTPDDFMNTRNEIQKATFDQAILLPETIERVLSQRTIFNPDILKRYEALHVPRLRKMLLIGPPGTGKTTLVKAMAAAHAKQGGYVAYVFADANEERSWSRLRYALNSAAHSGLPTLIVVEDLENFLHQKEMQGILNTLDGVATPDNPAGTLMVATSNAPERIDPRITQRPGRIDVTIEIGAIPNESLALRLLERFLHTAFRPEEHASFARKLVGQVGSHVREVALLASIKSVEQGQDQVSFENLLWAHEVLLEGRKATADLTTCEPPAAGKSGIGFGKP